MALDIKKLKELTTKGIKIAFSRSDAIETALRSYLNAMGCADKDKIDLLIKSGHIYHTFGPDMMERWYILGVHVLSVAPLNWSFDETLNN